MTTKKRPKSAGTSRKTSKAILFQRRFLHAEILLYLSLAIFVLTILGFVLVLFCNNIGENYIFIFIFYYLLAAVPLMIGFILAIIAAVWLNKLKSSAFPIPTSIKIIKAITLLQIPLAVLIGWMIFCGNWNLQVSIRRAALHSQIDQVYGDSYSNLDLCYDGDIFDSYFGSGDSEARAVADFTLENFAYPVHGYISTGRGSDNYADNYADLKRADDLGYQALIDELFGQNAIALMKVGEKIEYPNGRAPAEPFNHTFRTNIDLDLLLPRSVRNDSVALANKLQQIAEAYRGLLGDGTFSIRIFFADDIDPALEQEYYYAIDNFNYGICSAKRFADVPFYVNARDSINISLLGYSSKLFRDEIDDTLANYLK